MGMEFVIVAIISYMMMVSFTAALVHGIWKWNVSCSFMFGSIITATDCLMLIPIFVGTSAARAVGKRSVVSCFFLCGTIITAAYCLMLILIFVGTSAARVEGKRNDF